LHESLLSHASEPIARSDEYGKPIRILLVHPSHVSIKSTVKDMHLFVKKYGPVASRTSESSTITTFPKIDRDAAVHLAPDLASLSTGGGQSQMF
jgi:hypothetical protein